ncbi:hypothetical protein [Kitasatospora sp. NPDC050543]|uniref:hypothetical protein n=1 Tax=Kitasatospora sp. NPDC050543 TaxID=3364054 RepID=UPI0037B48742
MNDDRIRMTRMKILLAPAATGSGHNMRVLALAREILAQQPDAELTVLLASLQSTFTPLFTQAGVKVVDLAGGKPVDYATRSNLGRRMDWPGYIGGYLAPAFVNGERILHYLALIQEHRPDLVVSDYNMSASMAASILGTPHALVTERYDFTLCQLDDETLVAGGFDIDKEDLRRGRGALHACFEWIVNSAEVVLTDKPPVGELDEGTPVARALGEGGHAVFTGPMVRRFPERRDGAEIRAELGIPAGPLMVGSVGGTTMFLENKQRVIDCYLEAYRILRETRPDLRFVLLGREQVDAPEEVIQLDYLPDWMPLLQEADVLLSAPGWITVTEVAAMRIPTVFVLGSLSEYHEVEAARRLELLGFPTFVAPSAEELAGSLAPMLGQRPDGGQATPAQLAVAPDGAGTALAARHLLAAAARSATAGGAAAGHRGGR